MLRADGQNHQKGTGNPNTPGSLNKEFELRLGQRAATPQQNDSLGDNSRSTQGRREVKFSFVRDGKGDKDRITFLPEQAVPELRRQIEVAKRMHRLNVEQGFEQVYIVLNRERAFRQSRS